MMAWSMKFALCVSFTCTLLFVTLVTSQACPKGGIGCHECNVVLCPFINATPMVLQRCTGNTHCVNASATSATCEEGPCIDPSKPQAFTCVEAGMFPSASNTSMSYFCNGKDPAPATECVCGSGEEFDLASSTCKAGSTRKPATCDKNKVNKVNKMDGSTTHCFVCDQNLTAIILNCPPSEGDTPSNPGGEDNTPVTPENPGGEDNTPVTPENPGLDGTEEPEDTTTTTRSLTRAMTCGPYTGPPPAGGEQTPTPGPDTPPDATIAPPPDTPTDPPANEPTPAPTEPTPTQPPATQPPIPSTVRCRRNGERYAATNLNCTAFYQCDQMRPMVRVCPTGMRYEPTRFGCVSGSC